MSPSSGRRRPLVRPAVQPHLEILHTVAATVSRTLDVDDVLRTAVEALTRVTGHEIASLHLLSEDGRTLHLRGERGMSPGLRAVNQMLPVGQGLIGRVAATGQTVRVEKNYADPDLLPAARAAVRRERIRALVCVPINSRCRTLGKPQLLIATPRATDQVRERLRIVTDEATRAARIIQNLLLFARQSPPERRPCSLVDQARRVLELNSYQLQQDHVKVVTEFTPSPHVLGDENQLQQVLLNLVQNAHQAMVERPGARVLTVRSWPDGARVCLEVRDTGPGIPAELMPRIFDPFFTTKAPGEGSGLGLSVSYGIVTELGGQLWAENRPEGGASFILELPVGEDKR